MRAKKHVGYIGKSKFRLIYRVVSVTVPDAAISTSCCHVVAGIMKLYVQYVERTEAVVQK